MLTTVPINYVRGDATNPVGPGKRIIAHCCNDAGFWNAGFVRALSERYHRNATTVAGPEASRPFHSALARSNLSVSNLDCASQTSSASPESDLPQIQSQFATILSAKDSLAFACWHSNTTPVSTCRELAPAMRAATGKSSPRSSKTSFVPMA